MKFSIAHATARPGGWQDSAQQALGYAANINDVDYVLSVDERFGEFNGDCLKDIPGFVLKRLPPTERKCAVANWLNAINYTLGDVILVNSDDFFFPARWDDELRAVIGERDPLAKPFVIQVSTGGSRDDTLMTIQIGSRALINHWGYLLWPEYDGLFVDDDFSEHAFLDSQVEVIQARHLMFEHRHFTFGKSIRDEVYDHENRPEGSALGYQIIEKRRASNFK